MKYALLSGALCALLSGCVLPQYHGYAQEIRIIPPAGTSGTLVFGDEKIPLEAYPKELNVWRTAWSKPVVFKKDGFEDHHAKITSSLTEDKWALRDNQDVSALWILPLPNTLYYGFPWIIPGIFGLAIDIFNYANIPVMWAVNPWFDTDDLNMENVVLQPTEQFSAYCGPRQFASNIGCVPCDSFESPLAVLEECMKCPSRVYEDDRCRMKN
ncbi:MAG: hypothetical protein PHX68_03505 [Alphaproteobacteria bacterium]|nr:hypothetical protein [Alphaproteobacteria bacterium]